MPRNKLKRVAFGLIIILLALSAYTLSSIYMLGTLVVSPHVQAASTPQPVECEAWAITQEGKPLSRCYDEDYENVCYPNEVAMADGKVIMLLTCIDES